MKWLNSIRSPHRGRQVRLVLQQRARAGGATCKWSRCHRGGNEQEQRPAEVQAASSTFLTGSHGLKREIFQERHRRIRPEEHLRESRFRHRVGRPCAYLRGDAKVTPVKCDCESFLCGTGGREEEREREKEGRDAFLRWRRRIRGWSPVCGSGVKDTARSWRAGTSTGPRSIRRTATRQQVGGSSVSKSPVVVYV